MAYDDAESVELDDLNDRQRAHFRDILDRIERDEPVSDSDKDWAVEVLWSRWLTHETLTGLDALARFLAQAERGD